MRGFLPMGYRCYNKTRGLISASEPRIALSRFPISSTHNLLTAVGCDTRANIKAYEGEDYITGCLSMTGCDGLTNGSCLGMGCSQVPVPYDLTSFRIHAQSNTGKVGKWSYNNCTYAFLVEKDRYTFVETDLDNMRNRSFPVVLEWSVGNTSCKIAQMNKTTHLCKENSVCYDDSIISFNQGSQGYRCKCAQGYQGNPYLPNGCQDINECEGPKHDCVHACGNTNGSYNCSCPLGMGGDGRKDGTGCSYLEAAKSLKSSVYLGISMGTAGSAVLTLILYWGVKQRQIMKSREKFFKKNGGLILQKLLFESKHMEKIIFAARDLEKATNNFNKTNVIGQGGFGIVYKGILADKTTVAIKKSKSIDENQIEQFINEVIILSEISHPNVVKLLGCCLETQTPLLVYEFVANKTVFHHLHEKYEISSMAFERRLNLAAQISEALAHIHSSTQIIHRDVKSSNILLTDDFTAKVSDFGISRFIPVDETHLQTLVHGTLGYIDPEYFRSGILTVKSDVYSFGMVLVELLTGRKVFSPDGTESELGLATFFVSSMERGRLIQVLDDRVRNDGVNEHIEHLARLAKDCVELEGKKRPTMKEVKEKLEELRQSYSKSCIVSTKIKFIDFDELLLFD
ncbi:wall-associated receptor kinase 2-like [Cynara cardunculus var. scolymus]|uniref:wall-associated receptor kinase 2-like n=1 Tax=Cynara cardunculus var. scolymus TaxID=59895 RepID=UPI000D625646|nr:wall-associated receptor kinase 2-like [Cynara cardunculus var. scolymus]